MAEVNPQELAEVALKAARKAGAAYADFRLTRNRNQAVAARDRLIAEVGGFNFGPAGNFTSETYGFGVRTLVNGAWGFASSPEVTAAEAERIARLSADTARAAAIATRQRVVLSPAEKHVDRWRTPIRTDPFQAPLETKQALLLQVNERLLANKAIIRATSSMFFQHEWKYFASTEGSRIEQDIYRATIGYTAIAFVNGRVKSRTYLVPAQTAGYERVETAALVENAERIAEEAVEHARARPVSPGRRDLILKPSNAALTIHEVVGHPTELDRIAGYEANYAGTSFIGLRDIGRLKYGSRLFNAFADRTLAGGMATTGYDDDGVKTQRWPLVREGVLVGVQTNRETAHLVGEKFSRGCTFANHWKNFPFLRMPNVSAEAGPKGSPTPEEMIADTRDGILIDGMGSFSIDMQRYNGQFGGDAFWEIKNGKITGMVSDVVYQFITTEFWASLDAVAGPDSWQPYGLTGDAKGQPIQSNYPTHGCSWMRFRNVNILQARL